MVLLNRPGKLTPLQTLQLSQVQVISCPVVNVAVWGNQLEYFDHAIALEMDYSSRRSNVNLTQGTIACAVRVDVPIVLEAGEPNPLVTADEFEIIKAAKWGDINKWQTLYG